MKIKKLDIIAIYNKYNYHVRFHPDLTFLFGCNGCGKTTVLNIIEAIVSGRVYYLFSLEFKIIRLSYYDDECLPHSYRIIEICHADDNLYIKLKNRENVIQGKILKDDFQRIYEDAESYDEINRIMMKKYPLLDTIRKEFNYVYLPLNRNTGSSLDSVFYKQQNKYIRYRNFYYTNDRAHLQEEQIRRSAELVKRRFNEASVRISTINDEFRNRVLKSSLTTHTNTSNEEFVKSIIEIANGDGLESIRDQYYKLLNSLGLLDETEKNKYDLFFQTYKEQAMQIASVKYEKMQVPLSLIYDFCEIERMKTVTPFAQEMEEKKAEIQERINLFIDTMNSFIQEGNNDKELFIDDSGEIRFLNTAGETMDISVSDLSSGEKQILIIFANLVFNVDNSKSSIFVADEPELSLHLSWQKMFVEKAAKINSKMQLVFATHAPEIVGKNRRKMFKLERMQYENTEMGEK